MRHVSDLQGQSIAVRSAIPAIIVAEIQDGCSQGIREFDAFAPVAEIARVGRRSPGDADAGRLASRR